MSVQDDEERNCSLTIKQKQIAYEEKKEEFEKHSLLFNKVYTDHDTVMGCGW